MQRPPRPCPQCGVLTHEAYRCESCERMYQARRNADTKRAKYKDPIYRSSIATICTINPTHIGPYEKHHTSDTEWIGTCLTCHHLIENGKWAELYARANKSTYTAVAQKAESFG